MIVWQGKSTLVNQTKTNNTIHNREKTDITVIAPTTPTKNKKLGAMTQFWILMTHIHPDEAIKSKKDKGVCGNCKARGVWSEKLKKMVERHCYVGSYVLGQIWGKLKRGGYETWNWVVASIKWNRAIPYRFGAYGDPLSVPLTIWKDILATQPSPIKRWTGYTHFWGHLDKQAGKELFMASTDSPEETAEAQDLGWRVFEAWSGSDDDPAHPKLRGLILCPNTASGGKVKCETCLRCNGTSSLGPSIYNIVHGIGKKWFDRNVERSLGTHIPALSKSKA